MSPESVNYMSVAEAAYARAKRSFEAGIYENAARDSYTAVLNAARAVVFDKTGIAPKTHSGTRSKFHDLLRDGLIFDGRLAKFLSEGFDIKQSLDYGPDVMTVAHQEAKDYLDRAAAFIAAAERSCA